MMKSMLIAAAVAALLAGCATSPVPLGLPCSVGPVHPSKGFQQRWTRNEKDQVLLINETGEKLCRWKP